MSDEKTELTLSSYYIHTALNGCGTAESKYVTKVFESSSPLNKWKLQNVKEFQTTAGAGRMAMYLTNQKT